MTDMQNGSCHCGAVTLSFPQETEFAFSCHCDSCQKLVSGGRLLGFAIPDDALSVTGGVSEYRYDGGSGKEINLSFCPKCSTQLFAKPGAFEGKIVVRANALQKPSSFKPEQFLFPEDACAWDCVAIGE